MRGWGIEERGQSDVSAYSRAKERIVTYGDVRKVGFFAIESFVGRSVVAKGTGRGAIL